MTSSSPRTTRLSPVEAVRGLAFDASFLRRLRSGSASTSRRSRPRGGHRAGAGTPARTGAAGDERGDHRGRPPIAMPTDRDDVAAAILTCGRADLDRVILVRLRNTLDLEDLLVSESLCGQVEDPPDLEITGVATPPALRPGRAVGTLGPMTDDRTGSDGSSR